MFEVKGKYTAEIVQVYATERKQYDFGERTEFLLFDSKRSEYVWVNSAEYEPFNPFEIEAIHIDVNEETVKQMMEDLCRAPVVTTPQPSINARDVVVVIDGHEIKGFEVGPPVNELELMYEITKCLSNDELKEGLNTLREEYGYKVYRHRNGTEYVVDSGAIVNVGGKSYWGLHYQEFTGMAEDDTPIHTRPLFEFLDGRFELGKGENA